MINQAPIVRYTASVSETFFPNFWRKTFFISKRNGSVKRAPAPILSFCNDLSKKRPPHFAYNARSRSDMTPSIPLFR